MNNDKRNFHRAGEIVKVDIHDSRGNLIDRMKAHTTEKHKGALITGRVKTIFGVSEKDILEAENKEMQILAEPIIVKKIKPIVWKRDARGNII